jgi:asparagine synthase (glutamine-hydrolysing)
MGSPFFYVRSAEGKHFTQGQPSVFLGHKLPAPEGPEGGVFAEWSWGGEALVIRNDHFGFYPLFYYAKSGAICVSPSIAQLCRVCPSPEIDYRALALFLRLGFFLGNDTPFKDIKALPPGARIIWKQGQVTVSGGYVIEKPLAISRPKATDDFISLFRQAIKRRLPQGDFVMPLSAGRDSRHILFALNDLKRKPKFCITHHQYPPRSDDDVRIAAVLASVLNLEHVVLPQDKSRFQSEIRKNIITSFCSDEHTQALVMAEYLSGRTNTIYDGIAGMLAESFLINPEDVDGYQHHQYDQLADNLLRRWGPDEESLKCIMAPKAYARLNRQEAVDALVGEIKRHAEAANPIASFHFWNRTRREISLIPYAILREIPNVYSPYLDIDLCRFLMALPAELTVGGDFHTEAIQRAYPQYKDIPFGTKDKPGKEEAEKNKARYNQEFAWHYLGKFKAGSRFLNNRFLLPRIIRALMSKPYLHSLSWLPFSQALYLLQLEETIQ